MININIILKLNEINLINIYKTIEIMKNILFHYNSYYNNYKIMI